ncbi:MAG: DeoR/GlpR family DNA-binding transcription regulator [Kluyvera cryocrescens]|uniref:DeoR/GlpR family DNA-binding transcription regulator n=1 Tax=Kluyvera cryocrescens TaxID=580 RepID=UPI000D91F864|nr:DeoR/GlpR family DNA-binding transcription regulator [Kluyvera cryocrescens]MDU5685937.1 DeoR/GlpR family DNA-binding transcription regulator [Kluyvera cryocrescens]MEB6635388.1 DeoR/GlpR family DNA-binding transcription regulator [Kluyvera cryocrescens]MEB7715274.1 DeoR/GlpR family DNA-binding transcription regulator [Kluyvera cryocrescens]SQC32754.1 Glycerol-3-phosphate regulon repressor [Kluyvera cryocrescens]HAT1573098.1 DeoR/GlpR transcriptional regulator [Kluyvera cryocrescens]
MSLTELTGNPRHDQLLTLIADRGYMNIDELAQLLDVSTQTVRRDIRKLSEQGLITRHHGGAGRASSVVNTAFEQREVSWTEEKKAIAEAIADFIPDGSTIFITIGTTVEHVARALLNHNHLRIITNSLRVAHILYKNPRFEVMVPGGTLRAHNGGIIGPAANAFVSGFRADYLVTSVGAIENDGTLLEFDVNEASVVQVMMTHSRHLLLAADHTKYHASAAVEIGNVAQMTALFTDEVPGSALQGILKANQVEIVQVAAGGEEVAQA